MSSINSLSCPFEGDNFNNLKCYHCKLSPLDLKYLADGILCPRCAPNRFKKDITRFEDRYVILNELPEIIIQYTKEIEEYIDGKN